MGLDGGEEFDGHDDESLERLVALNQLAVFKIEAFENWSASKREIPMIEMMVKIEEEKAKLAKQKEQYQQYVNNSELERRQTHLLFVQLSQTELAAKQGAEVAQEIFRITSDRFAQGLTSSTELLMAGTKGKQQQLNLLYITTTKLSTIAYQEFLK